MTPETERRSGVRDDGSEVRYRQTGETGSGSSLTWSLALIGDDTAHKMGLCATQVGHKFIQILLQRDISSG